LLLSSHRKHQARETGVDVRATLLATTR